ncbi:DMT family transporter [Nodularia sp. UHCC 0506]|uniref:DMT family transporter n=1 Tax=Nodularia sp. UHCC 0506 TaxID=3110243 RepID=UPI002B2140BF|nr:SMR family transporter [Nodularia sp. UHCC 0506]MEA5514139.1 SMR family transporter [Nodularia sp. UHCC 0506]
MPQSIGFAWILLGLSAIGSCAGSLLLKQANLGLPNAGLLLLLTSPWFVVAIACYLFDLVFFAQALQQLSVSTAVPVASGLRIATTAILGTVFFREHFTYNHLLASCLITAGIAIMTRA